MFGGSPTSWEQSQSVSQTQRKYLVTGPTKASDPRGKTHLNEHAASTKKPKHPVAKCLFTVSNIT